MSITVTGFAYLRVKAAEQIVRARPTNKIISKCLKHRTEVRRVQKSLSPEPLDVPLQRLDLMHRGMLTHEEREQDVDLEGKWDWKAVKTELTDQTALDLADKAVWSRKWTKQLEDIQKWCVPTGRAAPCLLPPRRKLNSAPRVVPQVREERRKCQLSARASCSRQRHSLLLPGRTFRVGQGWKLLVVQPRGRHRHHCGTRPYACPTLRGQQKEGRSLALVAGSPRIPTRTERGCPRRRGRGGRQLALPPE